MPSIACLQALVFPAHFLVTLSTAQDCSNTSSRSRQSSSSRHSSATAWHAGGALYVTPLPPPPGEDCCCWLRLSGGRWAHTGCSFS
uniref:Putative secreted protein n=1 Tax=Anopheles darlingi TaxID=43151 RepID=A0A2M4DGU1_ANODA